MADPGDSRPHAGVEAQGFERAGTIVAELADALGSAMTALAEEQWKGLANRTSAIGKAAHCAARSLDDSGSPEFAGSIERAAARIDNFACLLRARNWREIGAETADFARGRPHLFGLGTVLIGFLAGRLLAAPSRDARGQQPAAAGRVPAAENRAPG